MSEDAEKLAKDAEILRRYNEIIKEKSDFWIERTGVYDPADLQDIEFESIDETLYIDDIDDLRIDEYWERGWVSSPFELKREDTVMFSDEVKHREFPTRYRLKDFRLSKSLRRVFNRNRDLQMCVRPLRITPDKCELYLKHEKRFYEHILFTLQRNYPFVNYSQTKLMETAVFCDGKLAAFSIFQLGEYSVYSDIACWDVKYWDRSLGILTVLLEMRYAAAKGYKYYYLAHYNKQSRLFQYKKRFPALEFYDWDNDRWIDAKTTEAEELLNQKLKYFYGKKDLDFYFMLVECVPYNQKDVLATAVIKPPDEADPTEISYLKILVITTDVEKHINDETADWSKSFGSLREQKIEENGVFRIIRAFYKNGIEIEFYFTSPDWANTEPISEETRKILAEGIKIFHDPEKLLDKLQTAFLSQDSN